MSNTVVNTNVSALNSHRSIISVGGRLARSSERLSSGMRINRAADDAAGLAISEKMRNQIRGLDQATRNSQDGISLVQTAEGALEEIHRILERTRELTNQASNDVYTDADRANILLEVDQLMAEINQTVANTEFNTMRLLGGGPISTDNRQDMILVTNEYNRISNESHRAFNDYADARALYDRASQALNNAQAAFDVARNGTNDGAFNQASFNLAAAQEVYSFTSRLRDLTREIAEVSLNGASEAEFTALTNRLTALRTTDGWNEGHAIPFNTKVAAGNIPSRGENPFGSPPWSFDNNAPANLQSIAKDAQDFNVRFERYRGNDGSNGGLRGQLSINIQGLSTGDDRSDVADALLDKHPGHNTAAAVDPSPSGLIEMANILQTGNLAASQPLDLQVQSGANANQRTAITINVMNLSGLGLQSFSHEFRAALVAEEGVPGGGRELSALQTTLDNAINTVSTTRSQLGATQNRLEHTINNLRVSSENLSASNSRIRDTDMAREMMAFTQANVLQQAGMSMLAQANMAPQNVLQLLG